MKKNPNARNPVPGGAAGMRRKLLPIVVAGCFGAGAASANPVGPQVVNGQVGFANQGNTLSITNSPGSIINWQSFSINQGEITRFIQQNSASAVLNRITGQDPSQILGALQSNGRVFLVNPNGILFGQGAQIDVNGLVASTLNISNDDFIAGRMRFNAGDRAGDLKNQGSITTPSGGRVYLIAPNVENSGIITSPQGEVLLAAGRTVQLVDSANPDLHVVVSAPDDQALNLGSILTQGGTAGIYGALIHQRGIVNADSAVVGENGKIVFKASGDTLLEAGSRTSATGAGNGGEIHMLGRRVGVTGDATIDASGQTGGGTVLIGGDYHGANANIQNAWRTYVGPDAEIRADATANGNGNGGKVIVWADDATRAYGSIFARGGQQSGNGGFVETSGHYLDVAGIRVNAGAPHGGNGNWLLDPTDIEVINGGSTVLTDFDQFADAPAGSQVSAGDISASGTDVTLQAMHDITFTDAVNIGTFGVNLTAQAGNTINVNNSISTNGGAIALLANDAGGPASGSGALNVNAAINSNGGNVTASGANVTFTSAGSISVGAGVANISAASAGGVISIVSGSSVSANGTGQINLRADDMSIAGTLNAGASGSVSLTSATPGRAIDLGTDTPGKLGLSAAELNRISAGRVSIGDTNTSGIQVTAPLTSGFQSLSLIAGGPIAQNPGALLGGALSLRLQGSSVTLLEANPTGVIAGRALDGDFQYRSINGIAVSYVDDAGGISVAGNANIKLISDMNISQTAPLIAGGLALKAKGGVFLTDLGNNIGKVVADLSMGGAGTGDLNLYSNTDLMVGGSIPVDGSTVSGITTNNASVVLTTGAYRMLTISEPIATGSGSNGHVDLQADKLALNSTISANEVSIRPTSTGRPITVGSISCHDIDPGDESCLSVTQLGNIIAPTIGIGRDASDNVGIPPSDGQLLGLSVMAGLGQMVGPGSANLAGPIYVEGITFGSSALTDRNVVTTRIGLLSGAGVSQGTALGIDVQDLGATAGGPGVVSLTNPNNRVANLAGNTMGGNFDFADSISLAVATLSGDSTSSSNGYILPGINAGAGQVSLRSAGSITGGLVTGQSVMVDAGNGIALATKAGSITASNSGTGDISITNNAAGSSSPLALQGVKQNGGGNINIINYGHLKVLGPVSSIGGNIALLANSPLTVSSSVSSTSGSIVLAAGATGVPGAGDTLTIDSAGTVSTGGNIWLAAGDDIALANPASVSSGSGKVLQLSKLNAAGAKTCTDAATLFSCVSQVFSQALVTSDPTLAMAANSALNTIVTTLPTTTTVSTTGSASTGTGTVAGTAEPSGSAGTAPEDNKSDDSKDEKKDDKKNAAGPEDKGAKKNESAKKMYCN